MKLNWDIRVVIVMAVFVAHKKQNGDTQTVLEHLCGTAEHLVHFTYPFGHERLAENLAWLHDLGKYSAAFQNRIVGNGAKADHKTAGVRKAVELYGSVGRVLAYAVAGHHGGLPNFGSSESGLRSYLERPYELDAAWENELSFHKDNSLQELLYKLAQDKQRGMAISFFTRMLFSSLVDADFLDTEAFMDEERARERGQPSSIAGLEKQLEQHYSTLKMGKGKINELRREIGEWCLQAAKCKQGFFSLTVPTGGGKTLASMRFALNHAKENNMRRVICVIPYTSIIEQNADVYRSILGTDNVLEHQSNYSFEPNGEYIDENTAKMLKRSSENWDAPIIVTTNVQFFESLFSNKPSQCRKLHNITKSIIMLDEAQMIDIYFLKPCLSALKQLVKYYNCTVVFCTATRPEFPLIDMPIYEIVPNVEHLFKAFERVSVEFLGECSDANIARKAEAESQCLIIVNTRKHAQMLHRELNINYKYHLSAQMCPEHRKICLQEVRERLCKGEPCTLVSTSLIECGVDISFPSVYRETAGLDSILQSAGRCNREGELSQKGRVLVFDSTEQYAALRGYQQMTAAIGKRILNEESVPNSPQAIHAYFELLYHKNRDVMDKNHILDEFERRAGALEFEFETAARNFKLIQDTDTLVIPYDKKAEDLMKNYKYSGGSIRDLRTYSISIYENQKKELKAKGAVEQVDNGLYFLRSLEGFYDMKVGLDIQAEVLMF